ncbi:HD domain-containing protein [Streptomyces mirabilis]|uniref:HD domain-containing protein n=1 Tax=Streptomyces mirabilis TaxID=68239 RepID=UPI003664E4EA
MSGARLLAWRGRREDQEQHLSCDELLARVSVQHPLADAGLIRTAHAEAVRWHQGQMRHSGAPVLTHCVAVAAIVAECGMPPAVVCAALLHDLEDTECPPERVAELFGPYVADLQRAIPATPLAPSPTAPVGTDPGCVPSFDESVLVIRLADRLHNMRTISFLSQATRWRKARETVEVFAPLARAAGLNQMSRELHDLASAELRSPAAPYAVTGRALALLARLLPSGQRSRWHEEWAAELAAHRTRRARTRYTCHVLWHTPSLWLTLRRPVGEWQS